jgi:thioesterase domain-containing protein
MRMHDEETKYLRLTLLRESHGQTPLFCFSGAGGQVGIFQAMASLMDGDQPVYGIDMQKFFDSDRKFTVEELAGLCLSVMRERQAHGPYHMCGYSFGALVAYDVASRLTRNGEDIGVLAMIDTGSPAFRPRLSSAEAKQLNKTYVANRVRRYFRLLADGNTRSFAGALLALLASRAGLGARSLIRRSFLALNRPMPDVFRNNSRALFEAWLAYNPPPCTLSLLLFYHEHRVAEYSGDRTLGWGLSASGHVEIELASQGHVEMMSFPCVRGFAAKLSEILNGEAK